MIAGVDSAIIGEQMVRSQPAGRPTRAAAVSLLSLSTSQGR